MSNTRSPYIDNARFFLICLVILGHGLEIIPSLSLFVRALYRLIYLFHMPAFVFLSGVLAARQKKPKIGNLFLQYIIFQILYLLCARHVLNPETKLQFTTPYWILWFSVSLICWKMLAPYLARLPHRLLPGLLVAVALVAGCDSSIGYTVSLSRTLVFLPFFMAGYIAQPQHLKLVHRIPGWAAALGFLASFLAAAFFSRARAFWFYGSIGYKPFGVSLARGMLYRFGVLVWGGILVALFLSLVPRERHVYSPLGARSGQLFYLHGFFFRFLYTLVARQLPPTSLWLKAVYSVGLLLVSLLLLSRAAGVVTYPLMDPEGFILGIYRRLRAVGERSVPS